MLAMSDRHLPRLWHHSTMMVECGLAFTYRHSILTAFDFLILSMDSGLFWFQ